MGKISKHLLNQGLLGGALEIYTISLSVKCLFLDSFPLELVAVRAECVFSSLQWQILRFDFDSREMLKPFILLWY